jgi:hypothetical protein
MKLPHWTKSLPRKVVITGVAYKITYNMRSGACFNCRTATIKVGCRCTRDTTLQSLVHEISEIAHVHLYNRFHNGDMRFVMNHDRFDTHNSELVAALRNCGLMK